MKTGLVKCDLMLHLNVTGGQLVSDKKEKEKKL